MGRARGRMRGEQFSSLNAYFTTHLSYTLDRHIATLYTNTPPTILLFGASRSTDALKAHHGGEGNVGFGGRCGNSASKEAKRKQREHLQRSVT